MSTTYLIAFGGRPKPAFLNNFLSVADAENVEVLAALLTTGPGCYNLAFTLPEEDDAFAICVTMALMPARWTTTDGKIEGFKTDI